MSEDIETFSSGSLLERVLGGPLYSRMDFHLPGELPPEGAEYLHGIARATGGSYGEGGAYPSLVSWTPREGGRVLVSVHSEGGGTSVQLVVDSRRSLGGTLSVAFGGAVVVLLAAIEFGPTGPGGPWAIHALPYAILFCGLTGIAALVWRSLRKTAKGTRRTIDGLMKEFRVLNRGGAS